MVPSSTAHDTGIHRRVFVMGCSRSGTTLLQGLLAGHSRVHTFPETGVFLRALGMRGHLLPWARLGLTLGKERKALRRLAEREVEAGRVPPPLPPGRWLLSRSLSDVVAYLDALTLERGADVWLEKTPRHVLHAARIRRIVPRSLCLHMVRDGRAVVASMVDRARRYPQRFPRQADPAYGIRQWNRSMRGTREAMEEPGHVVVLYQGLAAHPEATLRSLTRLLDLPFEARMLEEAHSRDVPTFPGTDEPWKAGARGPVRPALSKAHRVLGPDGGEDVEKKLDRTFYQQLEEALATAPGAVWLSGAGGGGVVSFRSPSV